MFAGGNPDQGKVVKKLINPGKHLPVDKGGDCHAHQKAVRSQ